MICLSLLLLLVHCDNPSNTIYQKKDTLAQLSKNDDKNEIDESNPAKYQKENHQENEENESTKKNVTNQKPKNKVGSKAKKTILLKDFFQKYIKPDFKEAKIVSDDVKNRFLAFEESSPSDSEISAMVYGNMAIWEGEKFDIIGFFYYALVEGSANLRIENMFFYDVNGKNITKELLDLDFIRQEMKTAIPDRKKKGFEGFEDFFVEIPENGTRLIFQLTNGGKLAEGEKIFANYLVMNWNKKKNRFEPAPDEPEYP